MNKRLLLTTAILLIVFKLLPAFAQFPSNEYQVKGAFVFNFAQFTEWPSGTFSAPDAPLVIGILGKDPYGEFMEELIRGENVKGHPIQLKRFRDVSEIAGVHILYIHKEFDITAKELADLNARSILTISDAEDFAEKGGMINFYKEAMKIRFEVNLESAKTGRIVLSSKLLRLARICCDR